MLEGKTRSQLMEDYGVDEEWVLNQKMVLGDLRLWLRDNKDLVEEKRSLIKKYTRKLKEDSKRVKELGRQIKAVDLLLKTPEFGPDPEWSESGDLDDCFCLSYTDSGTHVHLYFDYVRGEFERDEEILLDNIEYYSEVIEAAETWIDLEAKYKRGVEVIVENLMNTGNYTK